MSSGSTDLRPFLNQVARIVAKVRNDLLAAVIAGVAFGVALMSLFAADSARERAIAADVRSQMLQEELSMKVDRERAEELADKIALNEVRILQHESKDHE